MKVFVVEHSHQYGDPTMGLLALFQTKDSAEKYMEKKYPEYKKSEKSNKSDYYQSYYLDDSGEANWINVYEEDVKK